MENLSYTLYIVNHIHKYRRKKKMTKGKYVYIIYHGWAFPEKVTEFKTLKEAIAFIESQEDADCWCYEKWKMEK